MKKLMKNYKARVVIGTEFLAKLNPNWIKERSWFEDLDNFELGEDFYYKVLVSDSQDKEDKDNFYSTIIDAHHLAREYFGPNKNVDYECGFYIELHIKDEEKKKIHQEILDFLWWKTIYQEATEKGLFSQEEIEALQKKKKDFEKKIKIIEKNI
jgi:hypothetical protein